MADVFDFYVRDNRKINFEIAEPIMREDSGVTDFRFHIPKTLNGLEVSDWSWWFVFVNAKNEKYSIALTLSDDPESPLEFNIATYTVDYAMSIKAGSVQFALEAINTGTGGAIDNEWHTLTYETKVKETLQGNQAEYAETESDIISALIQEVRTKMNQVIGGATPAPVKYKAQMTNPNAVYLYIGSEPNEHAGHWYYHNGTTFVSGGVYGAGVVDAVPTQGSTNAVSSGGVYSALDTLQAQIPQIDPTLTQSGQAAAAKETGDRIDAVVGDVEQISEVVGTETVDDYEYVPVSFSISDSLSTWRGVTFEQNADGTVRAYGTNDSSTNRVLYRLTYNGSDMQLPIEGGETYRFSGRPSTDVDCTIDLRFATGGGVYVDSGGGVTFTPEESNTYYIVIAIGVGASIDAVFSPKLEKLQIVGQKTINVLSAKDTVARDEISDLESVIENFEGISDEVKVALLNCFKNVAWIDVHGQEYYDALESALYGVVSINAVYTQSGAVDTTDSLDSLKENLVVTAIKSNSTQEVIPANKYELSGALIEGTSTITVSYKNKTTTFDVTVTDARVVYELSSGFDLTGKAIDTGVAVFGQDANYTILVDVDLSIIPSDKNKGYALCHKTLATGTLRLGFDKDNSNILHFIDNVMYADGYVDAYTPGNISALTAHHLLWIVRMSNKVVRKVFFCDNTKLLDKTENVSSYMSDKDFTGNYFIGSQTNTTPGSYTFPGTVNLFKIYNTALDISEIESILDITL